MHHQGFSGFSRDLFPIIKLLFKPLDLLVFFSVVKEDSMNSKDVIEIDNGNHVENNLSDAAFSDEEDDIPLGMYYFTRLLNHR